EVLEQADPAPAQGRLERARLVVEPGVHDAGVVSGLVPGELGLLVEHGHLGPACGERPPDRQPDQARPHDPHPRHGPDAMRPTRPAAPDRPTRPLPGRPQPDPAGRTRSTGPAGRGPRARRDTWSAGIRAVTRGGRTGPGGWS